ncbi:MAG: AEC family transporter [Aminipila sp.]
MNTISLALDVVLPLLMLMLVGTISRKARIINDEVVKNLNKLIFTVLLPTLMFVNVYKTDIRQVFNLKLILFTVLITLIVFIISLKLVPIFEKENRRRGSMVQAMVRGNGAYFGIPITVALIGESYAGLMALVVAFASILYNLSSVIAFETFRGEKIDYLRIIKSVIKNPMIIGTVSGITFVIFNISIPSLIWKTMEDISSITTPLALITLGGSFVFTYAAKYKRELAIGVLIKLILIPALVLPLAIMLGFKNYEICCLFSLFTAPTAVATFAVAQQMEGDEVLAGQFVVFSSLVSIATIFIWIIILGPYMLI